MTYLAYRVRLQRHLSIVIFISILFSLWVQIPRIANLYTVEEDFRNLYWVNLYQDSSLYPDDPVIQRNITTLHFGQTKFILANDSPLYGLLFALKAPFISPLLFSKLLIFPLMFVAVFYFYQLITAVSSPKTALIATLTFTVFMLASHSAISVIGGLQRSFTYPLLLGLLYHLQQRQYGRASFFLFLSGGIYPTLFAVSALTYVFSCVVYDSKARWRVIINWRPTLFLGVTTILVVLMLLPSLAEIVGDVATNDNVQTTAVVNDNDRFAKGGIAQLFHLFPLIGRAGLASGIMDGVHLAILTVVAFLILWERRPQAHRLPLIFRHLLYASVIGFGLSAVMFLLTGSFVLYLPSRYTQATLPLIVLVFILLNVEMSLQTAVSRLIAHRQQIIWYVAPIALLSVGLVLFLPDTQTGTSESLLGRSPVLRWTLLGLTVLLTFLSFLVWRQKTNQTSAAPISKPAQPQPYSGILLGGALLLVALVYIQIVQRVFYTPSPAQQQLYAFVQTFPKDTLFAGEPCLGDDIPLYAKRVVLLSCEPRGYDSDVTLVRSALRAYYAADLTEVAAFCRAYQVDYLLVDTDRFQPDFLTMGNFYYEPFNSEMGEWLNGRSTFALQTIPDGQKLFQQENLFVVSCAADSLTEAE